MSINGKQGESCLSAIYYRMKGDTWDTSLNAEKTPMNLNLVVNLSSSVTVVNIIRHCKTSLHACLHSKNRNR